MQAEGMHWIACCGKNDKSERKRTWHGAAPICASAIVWETVAVWSSGDDSNPAEKQGRFRGTWFAVRLPYSTVSATAKRLNLWRPEQELNL